MTVEERAEEGASGVPAVLKPELGSELESEPTQEQGSAAIAAGVVPGPDGGVEQVVDEPEDADVRREAVAAIAQEPARPTGPLRTSSIAMVIPAQHLFGM